MGVEPGDWEAGESYEAERIGDHRRVYLVYQGELTDGRGEVQRIDAGVATVVSWQEGTILLDLEMVGFVGRVEIIEDGGHPGTKASPGFRGATVRVLERRGGGGMMR